MRCTVDFELPGTPYSPAGGVLGMAFHIEPGYPDFEQWTYQRVTEQLQLTARKLTTYPLEPRFVLPGHDEEVAQ